MIVHTTHDYRVYSSPTHPGDNKHRHQCPGQKFAQFMTALMLSAYDVRAASEDGRPMAEMPPVELNSAIISPPSQEVRLKLSPRRH
ncbi:hypothetical protein B0H13DRAFT_2389955 [Mycena leptocephala]|nr:hypothetical protein B0H13DRAFT_2389955 [Mycena leptocephala]